MNPSGACSVRATNSHRASAFPGRVQVPHTTPLIGSRCSMSPQSPPPLSPEEETVIAFSHLLDEADLPPEAEASVPVPPPSTDEVVARGIDELSARIWDWAEQYPGVGDTLSEFIAQVDPDTGGGDEGGSVAGMDLDDVSLPGEDASSGLPETDQPGVDEAGTEETGTRPAERNVGSAEPGRGRGGRRPGGHPGMTGDQPGSARNAAASELEDTDGLYVLRNAVNLARDLARTLRDRVA